METPHLQRGALNFYPDPVKRREQVIAIGIGSTGNGRNPIINGGRQPSCGGTSRMNREVHVRICERLRVQFPGATRQVRWGMRRCSAVTVGSSCGQQVDDVFDCFIGPMVGSLKATVGSVLWIGLMVKATVGEGTT